MKIKSVIIIGGVCVFLFVLGVFWGGRKESSLNDKLDLAKGKIVGLQEKLSLNDADHEQILENQRSELFEAKTKNSQLVTKLTSCQESSETLSEQLTAVQDRNEQLEQDLKTLQNEIRELLAKSAPTSTTRTTSSTTSSTPKPVENPDSTKSPPAEKIAEDKVDVAISNDKQASAQNEDNARESKVDVPANDVHPVEEPIESPQEEPIQSPQEEPIQSQEEPIQNAPEEPLQDVQDDLPDVKEQPPMDLPAGEKQNAEWAQQENNDANNWENAPPPPTGQLP